MLQLSGNETGNIYLNATQEHLLFYSGKWPGNSYLTCVVHLNDHSTVEIQASSGVTKDTPDLFSVDENKMKDVTD